MQRIALEQRDNATVVVKRAAAGGHPAEVLRREYEALRQLRHPSVVQLVSWDDRGDHLELTTRYVGHRSLADLGADVALADALRVSAALAAAVADLHGVGIGHGGLSADHVLVDGDFRPVLCSLGHSHPVDAALVAADTAQLGDTLGGLAVRVRTAASGHRADRRRIDAWEAVLADLREGRCSAAEAASQLSDLASALGDVTGRAITSRDTSAAAPRLDGTRSWRGRVSPISRRSERRRVESLAVSVGLVLLSLGAGWLGSSLRSDRGAPPTVVQAAPDEGRGVAVAQDPNAVPADGGDAREPDVDTDDCRGPASANSCDRACPPGRSSDGEGCGPAPAVFGNRVRVGNRWFTMGEPGDVVTIGDWNCDGVATPAMLRVATGEVFVFPHWPGSGLVEALPLARHVGAIDLRTPDDGACGDLLVVGVDDVVALQLGGQV